MSGRFVKITCEENVALIRASNGRGLMLRFGPGGVALDAEASAWALPILRRLRGQTFEEGAGI